MKTLRIILFALLGFVNLTATAQNGFTKKEEAKNEYKDSLKQGKWLEYIDVFWKPINQQNAFYYKLAIYDSGREQGIVRYYYKDEDRLYGEIPYINGKANGIATFYAGNGSLAWKQEYVNDKENGLSKVYGGINDTVVILEIPMVNDSINGVEKEFYTGGMLKRTTPYVLNQKEGTELEYDSLGRKTTETIYQNNQPVGIKKDYCYYNDGKLWWEASLNTQGQGIQSVYDEAGKQIVNDSVLTEEEHYEWEQKDSLLIDSVFAIGLNKPKEIARFLSKGQDINRENLGFGWQQASVGLGGGYSSITATIYYHNDSVVSYSMMQGLPQIQLPVLNKYIKWWGALFTGFDTAYYTNIRREKYSRITVRPYTYNEKAIYGPLPQYAFAWTKYPTVLSQKLLHYMSPETGNYYGFGGGFPVTQFPNRKAFNEIKDSLTTNELVALLYSINPTSRLTAIEYCIRTNNPILKQSIFKKWINTIYKEVPLMSTTRGCVGMQEDARTLVKEFSTY